jgi:hypothetical protein
MINATHERLHKSRTVQLRFADPKKRHSLHREQHRTGNMGMGTVDHVDLCSGCTTWHLVLKRLALVVTSLIGRSMRLMNAYTYSRLQCALCTTSTIADHRLCGHRPRSPTVVSVGIADRCQFTQLLASTATYPCPNASQLGSCIPAYTQTVP